MPTKQSDDKLENLSSSFKQSDGGDIDSQLTHILERYDLFYVSEQAVHNGKNIAIAALKELIQALQQEAEIRGFEKAQEVVETTRTAIIDPALVSILKNAGHKLRAEQRQLTQSEEKK